MWLRSSALSVVCGCCCCFFNLRQRFILLSAMALVEETAQRLWTKTEYTERQMEGVEERSERVREEGREKKGGFGYRRRMWWVTVVHCVQTYQPL